MKKHTHNSMLKLDYLFFETPCIILTLVLASSAFNNPFSQELLGHSLWKESVSSGDEVCPLFAIIVATDTPDAVVIPWREQNDRGAAIEQTLDATLKVSIS